MNECRNDVLVFTGNKGKYRDAVIALSSNSLNGYEDLGLHIKQMNAVDPPEIQNLECRVVAEDKFMKMRLTQPIHTWHLNNMLTEDTGLHILDAGMNGFPGAFVKFMENTMGIEGMQNTYQYCKAVFKSTVVVSVRGVIHVLENQQYGMIRPNVPVGSNGYGFETIFIPCPSPEENITINHLKHPLLGNVETLAEMTHEQRLLWSPRSRGYHQARNIIKHVLYS